MNMVIIRPAARHQILKGLRVAARILRYDIRDWGQLSTRVYDPVTRQYRPAVAMEKPENDVYAWKRLAADMGDIISMCAVIKAKADEAVKLLNGED